MDVDAVEIDWAPPSATRALDRFTQHLKAAGWDVSADGDLLRAQLARIRLAFSLQRGAWVCRSGAAPISAGAQDRYLLEMDRRK